MSCLWLLLPNINTGDMEFTDALGVISHWTTHKPFFHHLYQEMLGMQSSVPSKSNVKHKSQACMQIFGWAVFNAVVGGMGYRPMIYCKIEVAFSLTIIVPKNLHRALSTGETIKPLSYV